MASLFAPVEDGKIVETASQSSLKKATQSNNGMDKDAFLQLLVAQMQYQDPLEPTSNTEYISQYAQFSQVEQIQNMAASTDLARASSLVGESVYIKTTSSSGEPKYVEGKVDYVVFENNKAYLSIDEALYSLEDLDTIVDLEYKKAFDKAYDFTLSLNKLPAVTGIDLSYKEKIEELIEIYEGMNDYEKSFLAEDTVDRYKKYVKRLEEVKAADPAYQAAAKKAEDFTKLLDELPAASDLNASYQEKMDNLVKAYEDLSDYEKSFLEEKTVKRYENYVEKWDIVKLMAGTNQVMQMAAEASQMLQMAAETADKLQQGSAAMAGSAGSSTDAGSGTAAESGAGNATAAENGAESGAGSVTAAENGAESGAGNATAAENGAESGTAAESAGTAQETAAAV